MCGDQFDAALLVQQQQDRPTGGNLLHRSREAQLPGRTIRLGCGLQHAAANEVVGQQARLDFFADHLG